MGHRPPKPTEEVPLPDPGTVPMAPSLATSPSPQPPAHPLALSKSYGFAAWRIGYMVLPQALAATLHKIQDTNVICPAIPSQHAALGCLEVGPSYCAPHVAELQAVRDLLLEALGRPEYAALWRVCPAVHRQAAGAPPPPCRG